MSANATQSPEVAAYVEALTQLQEALGCGVVRTVGRVTQALGHTPTLQDLQEAYLRVKAGGDL